MRHEFGSQLQSASIDRRSPDAPLIWVQTSLALYIYLSLLFLFHCCGCSCWESKSVELDNYAALQTGNHNFFLLCKLLSAALADETYIKVVKINQIKERGLEM